MRGKGIVLGIGALVVLAGLVGWALSGGGSGGGAFGGSAPQVAREDATVRAAGREPAFGMADGGEAPDSGVAGMSRDAPASMPAGLALPQAGARIVKTADLALQLPKDSFDERFQQAVMLAGRHGGFVASSQTLDARSRSGSVVIRVPVNAFDAAMTDLRRLGKVRSAQVSGRDVTADYVDLEARLRNWRAQETVLLRLMSKANSIEESITVQRQLQEVQLAIEQIRGQLRVLDDQTGFATIAVTLTETGFVPAKPDVGPSLGRAWDQALDGFVAVIAAVLVGLGYLVPIALLALLAVGAWAAFRRLRPRMPAAGAAS